ncbi:MAG TPA: bifunctional metallophosphatase/5'-nucleotidase [candidate division Zixibacteria bacterium]|nr:bifunctional metallophosphatase/5'-nucleotidase [candidate division Zixibacteria bacterium]
MTVKEPSNTVYVDMDDVLCETARGCLAVVEREFGKRIPFDRVTSFDLGRSCGLGPEEAAELFRIMHRSEELLKLEPIGDAIAVLRRWAADGYRIAIVTGRPPSTEEASLEWLERHRVPHDRFLMVDKYGRFATENTAAISLPELAAHEFCWAVEDSEPMARFLADTMRVPVKLLSRPWNRAAGYHPRITRFDHWRELAGDQD